MNGRDICNRHSFELGSETALEFVMCGRLWYGDLAKMGAKFDCLQLGTDRGKTDKCHVYTFTETRVDVQQSLLAAMPRGPGWKCTCNDDLRPSIMPSWTTFGSPPYIIETPDINHERRGQGEKLGIQMHAFTDADHGNRLVVLVFDRRSAKFGEKAFSDVLVHVSLGSILNTSRHSQCAVQPPPDTPDQPPCPRGTDNLLSQRHHVPPLNTRAQRTLTQYPLHSRDHQGGVSEFGEGVSQ